MTEEAQFLIAETPAQLQAVAFGKAVSLAAYLEELSERKDLSEEQRIQFASDSVSVYALASRLKIEEAGHVS